jgi:hypothetical protein
VLGIITLVAVMVAPETAGKQRHAVGAMENWGRMSDQAQTSYSNLRELHAKETISHTPHLDDKVLSGRSLLRSWKRNLES